jgi:hypothetical protein
MRCGKLFMDILFCGMCWHHSYRMMDIFIAKFIRLVHPDCWTVFPPAGRVWRLFATPDIS